jgi:protoporphyrinogen oxidase
MEPGANFLSSAYSCVPRLAREAGVPLQVVPSGTGFVVGGQVHAVRLDRPWSVLTSGLMPWRSAPGVGRALANLARRSRGRRAADPADWLDLDHETTADLAARLGAPQLLHRIWEPMVNGFYFQTASDTSAAMVVAMASHGIRQRTLTVAGGLSRLTDQLAAALDVRCGQSVTAVFEGADHVEVIATGTTVVADRAVVAVPAPAARAVLPGLRGIESSLLRRPASQGLVVGIGVDRRLRQEELGGGYGVLLHPSDPPLAAACVASRAGHAPRPDHDLVTCLFTDADARQLGTAPDARIVQVATDALLGLTPTLAGHLRDLRTRPDAVSVHRIPYAMPTSPPGRARQVADYWRVAPERRVVLAGD